MGLLASWRLVQSYRAALEACGIAPELLPADMSARICSYISQQSDLSGSDAGETALSFQIERSATLVALCVLGPSEVPRHNKYGISMKHTVAEAAAAWRTGGPNATLDTKIIQAVGDAGYLSEDFVAWYSMMSRRY